MYHFILLLRNCQQVTLIDKYHKNSICLRQLGLILQNHSSCSVGTTSNLEKSSKLESKTDDKILIILAHIKIYFIINTIAYIDDLF